MKLFNDCLQYIPQQQRAEYLECTLRLAIDSKREDTIRALFPLIFTTQNPTEILQKLFVELPMEDKISEVSVALLSEVLEKNPQLTEVRDYLATQFSKTNLFNELCDEVLFKKPGYELRVKQLLKSSLYERARKSLTSDNIEERRYYQGEFAKLKKALATLRSKD